MPARTSAVPARNTPAFLLLALAALAVPAVLFPAAGAADCPVPAADCPLPTGRFVLTAVDGKPVSFPNPVYIDFAADGTVSGRVCNTFRGKAVVTDCVLTLAQAASTRRMCIDGALSALETRVHAMLAGGVAVIAAGEELTLRRDGGGLEFRKE